MKLKFLAMHSAIEIGFISRKLQKHRWFWNNFSQERNRRFSKKCFGFRLFLTSFFFKKNFRAFSNWLYDINLIILSHTPFSYFWGPLNSYFARSFSHQRFLSWVFFLVFSCCMLCTHILCTHFPPFDPVQGYFFISFISIG